MNTLSDRPDIHIDLWPEGRWKKEDLSEVLGVLGPFGSTAGTLSRDTRGLDLQTIIVFATGAIAAGFFKQIGSSVFDVSANLIRFLFKRLKPESDETQPTPFRAAGRSTVSYDEPTIGWDVSFVCRYSMEEELKYFFDNLQNADSMVRHHLSSGSAPFDSKSQYRITAKMDFDEGACFSELAVWEVDVRRFKYDDNDRLALNEFYKGTLPGGTWERDR